MKKRTWFIPVALFCLLGFSGCSIAGKEIVFEINQLGDSNVFSINEKNCPVKEAKLYLYNYKNLYGTMYSLDMKAEEFQDSSFETYVKDVTLNELARIYCMEQIAKEKEIELTEEEKQKVTNAAKQYLQSLNENEKSFFGIDQKKMEEFYTRYAMADKLYQTMTGGIHTEVSDDDARVIRIQQIVLTDDTKAQTVAQKLSSGEDFSGVANQYNQAQELEIVAARGDLPEKVEEVAFDLDNDEISEGIQTEKGTYFIKCINKYEEDLSEANKKIILREREQKKFEAAYRSFLDQADYELNESVWESISFGEEAEQVKTESFFSSYEKAFKEKEKTEK